jgi:catechol 2,3-dioxygenase-like lactoylglutathione lyase family enzyme
MYSHIMVGANDINESKSFYDAVFEVLGYKPGVFDEKGRVFYMSKSGVFSITVPINGEPACHGNGSTIGFAADNPAQADAWHAAGLANGGTACEDPPGIREGANGKLYLAYLRDPAGNKICALHQVS